MRRRIGNGWGFRLDYQKEIEQDQAEIDRLSTPAMIALGPILSRLAADPAISGRYVVESMGSWGIPALASVAPEIGPLLGFTPYDLACLAYVEERNLPGLPDVRGTPEEARAAWHHGRALEAMWAGFEPIPEEKRIENLRAAKSALARHTRNGKKWGGL